MNIVLDGSFLTASQPDGYTRFLIDMWLLLGRQHTADQFIFTTDVPYTVPAAWPHNLSAAVVLPKKKNSLVQTYWYNVKLPPALKRLGADLFIATAGITAGGDGTVQLLLMPPALLQNGKPGSLERKSIAQKRSIAKALKKPAAVITLTAIAKDQLSVAYYTDPAKITAIEPPADPLYQPLPFEVQEAVKRQYTAGIDYFICTHPRLQDKKLIEILRGFSLFKKRLQSSLKLVFAVAGTEVDPAFTEQLSTYKYKADVVLLTGLQPAAMAHLLAAAYGAVFTGSFKVFDTLLPEALQCGVPVLVADDTALVATGGGAGLSFTSHFKDIGEKLMQLYKDEAGRSRMIAAGKRIAAVRTVQAAADVVWRQITENAKR